VNSIQPQLETWKRLAAKAFPNHVDDLFIYVIVTPRGFTYRLQSDHGILANNLISGVDEKRFDAALRALAGET
jgi:hypothetical protein